MRKIFFSINILFLALVVFPTSGIFGLFNSNAAIANNTFSTAQVFPTPTPSSIPTPSPSALPSSTPQPTSSPTPNPSSTPQPDFPACPKDPGTAVDGKNWSVGYAQGWHWIIFEGMKFGSDYVYYLDGKDKVLQCYYPIPRTDSGIQTNWLKKTGNVDGYVEWSQGLDFGLNSGLYISKNIIFSTAAASPSPTPSASPIENITTESSLSAELES